MAIMIFGIFFILLFLNVPIAVSLGVASLFGLSSMHFDFSMIAPVFYGGITKVTLLAIPFFIFAGLIMERAEISIRLIRLAEVLVGKLYGGLAIVTVVVSCFFSAISGSGPATVAAVGVVLIPAMVAKGYGRQMPTSLMASCGSIGIIIPPSLVFVIYATIAEVSVSKIFLAGVFPGLVMAICYLTCALLLLRGNKNIQVQDKEYTTKEKLTVLKDALWGIMTPVIILGGIYGGFFTPTEAAGVAVIYGMFVGIFIYKSIKLKDIFKLTADAAVQTATVMIIVSCAGIFAWLLTTSLVARDMAAAVLSLSSSKLAIMLLMNLIFFLAGCFVDTISALFILVPIMLPIANQLGIDLVQFGVFLTVNLAIGQFTPPVGVDLYVACNIGNEPLKNVIKTQIPFIIAGIIGLLVITYVPQLSLWLPDFVMGK